MSEKTAAEKARVKPGTTIAVLGDEPGVVASLGLPPDTPFVAADVAQIVLLFVHARAELDAGLPPVAASLAPGAAVWVFYRKGSKAAGFDVNRDDIWALAEKLGMRPLGLLGVDETWSAFRLRMGK